MDDTSNTGDSERRQTAIHEAGHVVAAHLLGVTFKYVTIIETDESAGHVYQDSLLTRFADRLEEADYASSYGRFINGTTRRLVESDVIVSLAGGLVTERLAGVADTEVGSGLVALDEDQAKAMAAKYGGDPSDWKRMIIGGDEKAAWNLVEKVSGSDEEASAYLEWLRQRTRNLLNHPYFKPAHEAVVEKLLVEGAMSADDLRPVIADAIEREQERLLEQYQWRDAGGEV